MAKNKLPHKIKGYVIWQLEHYHEDKSYLKSYRDSLMPSATAAYGITGGRGGISNPTETAGIKLATDPYILSTERSCKAIEKVLDKCSDEDKRMIDLIYWQKKNTVTGAGMEVGLMQNGAYKRINKILYRIALELGCVNL